MALKRQQSYLETFSMASMTDVVFLLLVFFMVTSTFVFPTGMDVNLPQSTEQTTLKPSTRIYVTDNASVTVRHGDNEAVAFDTEDLLIDYILRVNETDSVTAVAIYADSEVEYGRVIDILNMGARNNIKMVLATAPGTAVNASTTDDAAQSQPLTTYP